MQFVKVGLREGGRCGNVLRRKLFTQRSAKSTAGGSSDSSTTRGLLAAGCLIFGVGVGLVGFVSFDSSP